MRIVVASQNAGKLTEIRALVGELGLEVVSMGEAGVDPQTELPEHEDTFEGNAASKAAALQRLTGGWTLADDSGLEVDALGGAPGVRSARYSGAAGAARDRANIDKLLEALAEVPTARRTARFVCCMVLCGPAGERLLARGACQGWILERPRGAGGFGYDPVFLPEGHARSMAELPLAEKNLISHRGRALRAMVEQIRTVKFT